MLQNTLLFAPTLQLQHAALATSNHTYRMPPDYASYQVDLHRLEEAIVTLERGRALLWSEMRHFRASIDQSLPVWPRVRKLVDLAVTRDVTQGEDQSGGSKAAEVDAWSDGTVRTTLPMQASTPPPRHARQRKAPTGTPPHRNTTPILFLSLVCTGPVLTRSRTLLVQLSSMSLDAGTSFSTVRFSS